MLIFLFSCDCDFNMLFFCFLLCLQRKQREVAKENEFYYELLVQSLPSEHQEAYHLRNSTSQVTFVQMLSIIF